MVCAQKLTERICFLRLSALKFMCAKKYLALQYTVMSQIYH